MTAAVATDQTPKVWIGCLACYNSGYLVGDWFDAVDADETTLADVHRGSGRPYAACEELWCFDHELIPASGEMSPHEAAEWGRVLTEADEHLRPALRSWVRSGSYVAEGRGDLPSIPDFLERFCGHWPSFRDYAEQMADDVGLMIGWPETAASYFNWSSWVEDQRHDYVVEDAPAPEYGVYVFRNQ